jgi:glucokinase
MTHSIAVDFGGTNIRAAYFPKPEPRPETQVKIPTLAEQGPDVVIDRLVSAVRDVGPSDLAGIRVGIASPGPLDPLEGIIFKAPNLIGWTDIPLKQLVEDRLNCEVFLGNDANVAALGEWKFGAGRGSSHMIYLTISTGIGGGVIVNDQLLLGSRGLAAELGHITVQPDGPQCGCGIHGHIEALASGTAIARRAMRAVQDGAETDLEAIYEARGEITAAEVGAAAEAGDEFAISLITNAGKLIGHLLSDLAHIFNTQTFVLGGGVAQIGALLFDPIEKSFGNHLMDPAYGDGVQILPAALGDDAGLVGAMVLATRT